VAAVVVSWVSTALDLDLVSVALLGASVGAVVALVNDSTPFLRVAGFLGGFFVGWVSYFGRALFLPDTDGGRAVAVGAAVLLSAVIAGISASRLPLWSILLGAGTFAGAYEFAYNEAPPEILSTSVSTASTLILTFAIGFLAAAIVEPITKPRRAAL
jgi:hypothetical protein